MPFLDIEDKKVIERFLVVAAVRQQMNNRTYVRLTNLLTELTTERTEPEVAQATTAPQLITATSSPIPAQPTSQSPPSPSPSPSPPPQGVVAVPRSRRRPRPEQLPERRISVAVRKRREVAADRDVLAMVSRAWSHLIGDVLANVLLYVGVILATAAVFSFFAFGHFGRVVTNPDARPLVFVAVPLAFAGMARLLRKQVSVQLSADAMGVIAALTLPIMMSGFFRDGSNQIFPDVDGSPRWAMYAIVGAICTGVYLRLARGRAVYAYLAAPMMWATAGALGLYVTFGMSSYQLYVVLAVMALTVFAVAKRPVAPITTATARVAVVAFPVVLLTAMTFAFRNGDDPLGPSPAAAAAVTGFMLLALSTVDAVWSGLTVRSRDAVTSSLRGAGYLALGLALVLTVSWLAEPTWTGPSVVAYALAVWLIHKRIGGVGDWLPTAARFAALGGALVSLPFVAPSIVLLTALTVLSILWLLGGPVREIAQQFVGDSVSSDDLNRLAAWAPVALGSLGFFRLDYPLGGWLLLATALASAISRWFPGRASRLGVYSGYPELTLAAITLVYAAMYRPVPSGDAWFVILLLGVSAAAGMSSARWLARGWIVFSALFAAVLEVAPAQHTLEVVSVVAVVVGIGCVAATQMQRFSSETLVNSLYGHVLLALGAGFAVASNTWALLLVVGVVLTAVHIVEAALAERGTLVWISAAGRYMPSERGTTYGLPTVFASASFGLVLVSLWESTGSSVTVGFAMASWAVVMAALMFRGLANRDASRASVYVFVAGGAVLGATGSQGWTVTLVGSLAFVILFLAAQRPMDLYVSIAGVGMGVTHLVAERGDIELMLLTMVAYGATLMLGTSTWTVLRGSRTLTVMRRPFIDVGGAMLAIGSLTMVALSLGRQSGDADARLIAGLALLAAVVVVGFTGTALRWRWSGTIVASAFPVSYVLVASSATDTPFHPITIAPAVASLVLLALTLPDRRTIDPVASPAGAMMLSALATSSAAIFFGVGSPYLSWSILMVAAVVIAARFWWQIVALRYVAAALILAAGGIAGPDELFLASIVMFLVTVWWEIRAAAIEALVLRWVATALVLTVSVLAVEVFQIPTAEAGFTALGFGVIAIVGSVVLGTTQRAQWMSRWWPQIAIAGRIWAAIGVLALATISETAALFGLALWNGVEAAAAARYAVSRVSELLAWLAATLAVTTGLLVAFAAATPLIPVAFMWWFIGLAGIVAWTTILGRGTTTMWDAPLGTYAHLAIVMSSAVVVTDSGSISMARAVVTASLLAFALSWITLARARKSEMFALIGIMAGAASWCAATGSIDNPTENVVRWLPALVVTTGSWGFIAHSSREDRFMWERAFAVASGALFLVILASSVEIDDRGSWLRVAILLGVAAAFIYDIPTLRQGPVTGSDMARVLVVISAWLLGGWYIPGDPASIALIGSVAVAGAVIAVLSASRSSEGAHPDTWVWVGIEAGASLAALVVFGWPSPVAVFVLLLAASSVVSYGVLSGSRRWTMAGVEGFVMIGAALAFENGLTSMVSAALVGSIAVLIATETERLISASRDEHLADWIRTIEWLALLTPPAVIVASAFEDLGYLPLLATFGAVALLWGIVTQVRRRVFAGAVSIVSAVVLGLVTPMVEAISVGMATAGAVGITFAVGVLVIVVAILIERYQQSMGQKLTRLTDAMADWE